MSTHHTSKIFNTHPKLDITKSPQDPIIAVSNESQLSHDITKFEEDVISVTVDEKDHYNPEIAKSDQHAITINYEKNQPKYDKQENHKSDIGMTIKTTQIFNDNSPHQQNNSFEIVHDTHLDNYNTVPIRTQMIEDIQQNYSPNTHIDADVIKTDDEVIIANINERQQQTKSLIDTIRPTEIVQNNFKDQTDDIIIINPSIEDKNKNTRMGSNQGYSLATPPFENQTEAEDTISTYMYQNIDHTGKFNISTSKTEEDEVENLSKLDDVEQVKGLLSLPKQTIDNSVESSRNSLDSTGSSLVLSDATTVRTAKKLSVQFVNYSSQSSADEESFRRAESRLSHQSMASSDTKSDTSNIVGMTRRMSDHSIAYSSDGEVTRASSILSIASADSNTNYKMASRISNQSETSASDVEIGKASRTSDHSIAYSSTSTDGEIKSARRASDNSVVYSSDGLSRSASRVSNYSAYSSTNEADIGLARRISNASSTATLADDETVQSATKMSNTSEALSKLNAA